MTKFIQTKPLGNAIRRARREQDWDRRRLAKKLKITPGYVGHLERGDPVYLSGPLLDRICKTLRLPKTKLARLADLQNKRAADYGRALRAAHA